MPEKLPANEVHISRLYAPKPGRVTQLLVHPGDKVRVGAVLAHLSSNAIIKSPCHGIIDKLPVKEGDWVIPSFIIAEVITK